MGRGKGFHVRLNAVLLGGGRHAGGGVHVEVLEVGQLIASIIPIRPATHVGGHHRKGGEVGQHAVEAVGMGVVEAGIPHVHEDGEIVLHA